MRACRTMTVVMALAALTIGCDEPHAIELSGVRVCRVKAMFSGGARNAVIKAGGDPQLITTSTYMYAAGGNAIPGYPRIACKAVTKRKSWLYTTHEVVGYKCDYF
jgi:hypothetical protein